MPKTRKGNACGAGSFSGCHTDDGLKAKQAVQQGKNHAPEWLKREGMVKFAG